MVGSTLFGQVEVSVGQEAATLASAQIQTETEGVPCDDSSTVTSATSTMLDERINIRKLAALAHVVLTWH